MRGTAGRIAAFALSIGLLACGFHLRGEAHYPFATLFLNSAPALPITTELKRSLEGIGSAQLVAAAAGVYFGAKSRSDLNRAEAAYRTNGAYQPSDLDALRSGNSAAHTANALLIASGVLLAAGAALTFAF